MYAAGKSVLLFILTATYLINATGLHAQLYWCGTDQFATAPTFHEKNINQTKLESRSTIIVPVVVHIVWNRSTENLSDTQIIKQIERLNIDFNNTNVFNSPAPKEFRKFIGSPNIRFCLSSKDPDGNPSNGITRTFTTQNFIGTKKNNQNNFSIYASNDGGKDAWNTDLYINIWVGKLENLFGRSSIAGSIKNKNEDGIVIDPTVFNADPAQNLKGRTLVHEMGHYLGLIHTWGQNIGDCDEEDGIADTPVQAAPYFDCPSYPQNSCNSNDMTMNYMDFVNDECMYFFTKGQSEKMIQSVLTFRAKLMNSSAISCAKDFKSPDLKSLVIKVKRDIIQIQSPMLLSAPIDFLVCNAIGQVLKSDRIYILSESEIFIKNWPEGIYFLYFRFNKDYRVIKILKQST